MSRPPSERTRVADQILEDQVAKLAVKGYKKDAQALRIWASIYFKPFQREWMFDPARFAICCKARQIGISHTTGALAGVLWGAFSGERTTIVSKDQDASDNVLEFAIKHADVLRQAGSQLARTTKKNRELIEFKSGGSVVSLPSTGGRSYSGNVVLDEFAYQGHARKVWDNVAPVAQLGYKIRVISTPNGVGNEFHNLWDYATNPERRRGVRGMGARRTRWSAHLFPLERAIAEGFRIDLDDCWDIAMGDPRLFAQFYECNFLDAEFQYIPTEAITACLTHTECGPFDDHKYDYYAGLDIGREVDLSALVVVRRTKATGRCRIVYVETIKRSDTAGLRDLVAYAFRTYKLKRLCVDQTGLGTFPSIDLKKEFSEKIDVAWRRPKVEPLDFTAPLKEKLATGLYSVISKGSLEIPGSDGALPIVARTRDDGTIAKGNEPGTTKHLEREFASIQRKVTQSANVVYETPRTREGHADRAWATMLALYARDPVHPMLALAGATA